MIQKQKSLLRKNVRNIINSLENRRERDEVICNKILLNPNFINSKSVLLYFPTSREVNIKKIIDYCFESKKEVYFPFIHELKIGKVDSIDDLEKVEAINNTYYQPKNESLEFNIDLVVIPGLAFNKENYRLGQGKGWYDRFLSINKNIYSLGVCYKEQIFSEFPKDDNDKKMDLVICD